VTNDYGAVAVPELEQLDTTEAGWTEPYPIW